MENGWQDNKITCKQGNENYKSSIVCTLSHRPTLYTDNGVKSISRQEQSILGMNMV